ncbi:MAG: SprT family zinc-dependent metalloprotease [Pseudomonadota bacterium]
MVKTLAVGGMPGLVAHVRRSSRTRRLSLRVSALDGRVTLSLPKSVPLREAEAFLQERAEWLRSAVASQPPLIPVKPGAKLPVAGKELAVVERSSRACVIEHSAIATRAGRPAGPQVAALLKRHARVHLTAACEKYGAAVGRMPVRITLRDPRSRWGSCTSSGNLMFSWRLAMAPLPVLDYVAAHEVAHLRQMNHSARFWALVRQLCPEYEPRRAWLHRHGADLHRYRFSGEQG